MWDLGRSLDIKTIFIFTNAHAQSHLRLCFFPWVNCHVGWQSVTWSCMIASHVTWRHLLRPRSQIKTTIIYLFCLVGRPRSHAALFIWQSVLERSLSLTRQTKTDLFILGDAARDNFFVERALRKPVGTRFSSRKTSGLPRSEVPLSSSFCRFIAPSSFRPSRFRNQESGAITGQGVCTSEACFAGTHEHRRRGRSSGIRRVQQLTWEF